jgi:hypothetical protein
LRTAYSTHNKEHTVRKLLSTILIALAAVGAAGSSYAQGWFPLVKAGGGTLSFSWQSSAVSGSTPAPSSTLFTTQAIGTASSDRIVVVGISWKGTASAGMDIPSSGVTIGGVTATQGAYLRGTNSRATAIYYANVTTGTTATIGITGYSNGFIDEIIINTGIITGSGTTSNPSNITSVPPGYSSGTTGQAVTVPTNGVSVICAISDNNGFAPTSSFSNATLDKDQYDTNTFGNTGTMAHLTASATVTMGTNSGASTGWVAINFQP